MGDATALGSLLRDPGANSGAVPNGWVPCASGPRSHMARCSLSATWCWGPVPPTQGGQKSARGAGQVALVGRLPERVGVAPELGG
jgi:hypothetical protein